MTSADSIRSRVATRTLLRFAAGALAAVSLLSMAPAPASAQPKKAVPGQKGGPPGTGTDLEIDPDAKPPEPKPLPPPAPDAWGVGGKEDVKEDASKEADGKFAPQTQKKKEEDEDKKPFDLGPPGFFGVDAVIGFGSYKNIADNSGVTNLTVASFLFDLQYRFGELWTIGVRLPFSNGSTKGPLMQGDNFSTSAIGNFEVQMQSSFELSRRWHVPASISFVAPTAAGDLLASTADNASFATGVINGAANATRGWEETALFASKRLGLVPSVGLTLDRDRFHFGLNTKFELMLKAGGNATSVGSLAATSAFTPGCDAIGGGACYKLNDPNYNWVTGLSAAADFFERKLTVGLRGWLSVDKEALSTTTTDYSGLAGAIEPAVSTRIGLNADGSLAINAGVSYIQPFRGDGAGASGVRLKAAFQF